jgi:tRNA dimethylallyltransferase
MPADRSQLHARITKRFEHMLECGFMEEVEHLFKRKDLHPDLPSIRSVGYRQAWDYFSGKINFNEMKESAIAATRQLAKRQMTWLRSWPKLICLNADSENVYQQISHWQMQHPQVF